MTDRPAPGRVLLVMNEPEIPGESLRAIAERHGGKIHQLLGPISVYLFREPEGACRAAVEAQERVLEAEPSPGGAGWRAGIAAGPPQEALELSLRLHGLTRSGEICVDGSVERQIRGTAIPCRSVGRRQFPGRATPVELFSIGRPRAAPAAAQAEALLDLPVEALLERPCPAPSLLERQSSLDAVARKIVAEPSPAPAGAPLALAERAVPPRRAGPPRQRSATYESARRNRRLSPLSVAAGGFLLTAGLASLALYLIREPDLYDPDEIVRHGVETSEVMKSIEKPRRAEPVHAKLVLETSPPGASVRIDEKPLRGKTPLTIGRLAPDVPFKIEVRKPGYEEAAALLNLRAGEERRLSLALTKLTERGNPSRSRPK